MFINVNISYFDMWQLDIVDEQDNIMGKEDFEKVHSEGLRHKSVQIFVIEYEDYRDTVSKLLVAERSGRQKTSALKLHSSAGGHVKIGQTYLEAALEELREELFHDRTDLPRGIVLNEFGRYKNDTRPTNKENTCLFVVRYSGPFSPDPAEISRVFWQDSKEVKKKMKSEPEKYTKSFRNVMSEYMYVLHRE